MLNFDSIEIGNTIQLSSNKLGKDDGVYLTWEDLWVTVSSKNAKNILQEVSGYAYPGQVLALMAPSGSGKSTLLDALAGRLDMNTKQSGQILAYVTQDDALVTTLTLKESVYYSSELQLPASMSKSEKRKRADDCIKEMGLQESINTTIGGGLGIKGLSGGERRRLSICIEILTHPKLLFLDEPTSGLDSAASFYVMSRILDNERRNGRTIIASIHQPSGQVFRLFDNLCLLSAGKIVYFGPVTETNEYFAANGYPCPSLQNPADHFLELINKDFDEDIEQGLYERKSTEENVNILLKLYKSSENYKQVRGVISTICKQKGEKLETKKRHASFTTQCRVLTRRSFVNMYRDLGYYWLRFFVYLVMAFGLGSIFFDLRNTYNSIQ
ncbi:ABC transporter G family member 11, partial [Bienertia sinuspersici]